MTDTVTMVPLDVKEAEAIMWGLGQIVNYPTRRVISATDPLSVLFDEGFDRAAIMKAGNELFSIPYEKWIKDPLTSLEKAILRVCVENSTWIETYAEKSPHLVAGAKAALRSLAKKLEAFDIEVNHIPNA